MALSNKQFLMIKLAEEASELAQIALKTAQFGPLEKHPDLDENNLERIEAEFNDLAAILVMLREEEQVCIDVDEDCIAAKILKVGTFREYSKQCESKGLTT